MLVSRAVNKYRRLVKQAKDGPGRQTPLTLYFFVVQTPMSRLTISKIERRPRSQLQLLVTRVTCLLDQAVANGPSQVLFSPASFVPSARTIIYYCIFCLNTTQTAGRSEPSIGKCHLRQELQLLCLRRRSSSTCRGLWLLLVLYLNGYWLWVVIIVLRLPRKASCSCC